MQAIIQAAVRPSSLAPTPDSNPLTSATPALYDALRALVADHVNGLAIIRPSRLVQIRAALALVEGGEA